MWDFKKNFVFRQQVVVGAFFIALFVIGLSIFKDYGVHWDEYYNQDFGHRWMNYVFAVAKAQLLSVPLPQFFLSDLIHGPVFAVFLVALTDPYQLKDSRDVILMRHLIVFLLFYVSVIFFYLLCRRHFQNWRLGLLGCVFLVLSPRIFADAFYNCVDIAFLSFFIIGMFTLVVMLDKRTISSALIHAFVCAILINIRLIGLFLSIVTVVFFCLEVKRAHLIKDRMADQRVLTGHLISLSVLIVLFNPFLWAHPLTNFIRLVSCTVNYKELSGGVHYLGGFFRHGALPWHYALVWIMVSTPLLYLFLFFAGIFASLKLFFRNGTGSYLTKRNTAIFLVCFSLPLIIATGKLFNGWRHIYFIYPLLLILAVIGFQYVWQNIRPVVRGVLIVGLAFGSLDTALFMVRNHPYQNVYFNLLAGKNASEITNRFDLDYWGLSYRKALEYILKTDGEAIIPVYFSSETPGNNNLKILLPEERKRLVCVPVEKAKYFLANNMVPISKKYREGEYHVIQVDGLKILIVYRPGIKVGNSGVQK